MSIYTWIDGDCGRITVYYCDFNKNYFLKFNKTAVLS